MTDVKTPNIDRLAQEGRRFTDFYVAQVRCLHGVASGVDGPGAIQIESALSGALNHTSTVGIHPDELLLPEMLKQKRYATAILANGIWGQHRNSCRSTMAWTSLWNSVFERQYEISSRTGGFDAAAAIV